MLDVNALNVIFPVQRYGVWAFDDISTGLVNEPFVMGMPEIIDDLVQEVAGAEDGFALIFSENWFPNFQAELLWLGEDSGGHWYQVEATGREGWLCPALHRYFETAPARLFVAAEPLKEN